MYQPNACIHAYTCMFTLVVHAMVENCSLIMRCIWSYYILEGRVFLLQAHIYCLLGWCVYYTCLKRLSTFFTIVAVSTDYCIWMTGSPPSTIRFHLLNAGQNDALKLCIWFKSTNRKDVYKVAKIPYPVCAQCYGCQGIIIRGSVVVLLL